MSTHPPGPAPDRLPRHRRRITPRIRPLALRRGRKRAEAPLVLLADDDAGIRGGLVDLLTDAGYRARMAANGSELVEMARRERPDVVLLDLAMPGPGGTETARALRALEGMEGVPIVATTSSWLAERIDLLVPFGFTAGLRKPFGGAALLELLDRALVGARGVDRVPAVGGQ